LKLRGDIVEKHRPLDFEIFGQGSIFKEDRTIGLWEITRAIEAAKKDDRIDGIYLELRDFSAGWATLTALHDKLEDFRQSLRLRRHVLEQSLLSRDRRRSHFHSTLWRARVPRLEHE
jgi:hypothetical protein